VSRASLRHGIKLILCCRRGEEVQRGVAGLQREREALEAGVLDMSGKTVALDRWLADNEAKIPEGNLTQHALITLSGLWPSHLRLCSVSLLVLVLQCSSLALPL